MHITFDSSVFWNGLGGIASITAILGFYIWLAPNSIIQKINEKFLLSETRIGYALQSFSEKRFSLPWHEVIMQLLINLFGERYFSARAFTRTNIHSYVVCIVIMYTLALVNALKKNPSEVGSSAFELVLFAPVFAIGVVSANLVTDFLAVGLCRWSMKKTQNSSCAMVVCGVIFMFFVCVVLGVVSIIIKELQLSGAEFAWRQYDESMERNPVVARMQHIMAFLTTFSVIIWTFVFLLVRFTSGLVRSIINLAQVPAGLSPIVNYPLRCLVMLTVTLAIVLVVVSSINW